MHLPPTVRPGAAEFPAVEAFNECENPWLSFLDDQDNKDQRMLVTDC